MKVQQLAATSENIGTQKLGCAGNCVRRAKNTRQKISVRSEHGVRVCETSDVAVAVAAILGRRADVVLYHSGSVERAALETIVDLLGGDRESGPFERYRRIAFDPAKTHSIAESCATHPMHTDGSFEKEVPASFALHCEVADPNGGGINTFLSISSMLNDLPHKLFNALTRAKVTFGRQDDSGRHDIFTTEMLYPRNGGWAFRWRDDEQVRPIIVDDAGTPAKEALEWVRAYIKAAEPVELFNKPGDIVIVNNDTVFHGRTSLTPNSSRSIVRAWIQN